MRILVLENNLLWSSKLHRSLSHFGHEAEVSVRDSGAAYDVAIVNLSVPDLRNQIPGLTQRGVYVIGHAGHKEKELHEIGRELGCSRLATNSELTFKIDKLISEAVPA